LGNAGFRVTRKALSAGGREKSNFLQVICGGVPGGSKPATQNGTTGDAKW
jgi:hypothetical protein